MDMCSAFAFNCMPHQERVRKKKCINNNEVRVLYSLALIHRGNRVLFDRRTVWWYLVEYYAALRTQFPFSLFSFGVSFFVPFIAHRSSLLRVRKFISTYVAVESCTFIWYEYRQRRAILSLGNEKAVVVVGVVVFVATAAAGIPVDATTCTIFNIKLCRTHLCMCANCRTFVRLWCVYRFLSIFWFGK